MKNRSIARTNSDRTLAQEYQRAGEYMFGFLAREQLITMQALSQPWWKLFQVWVDPVPSIGYMSHADSRRG